MTQLYSVSGKKIVAETAELRVVEFVLGPDEEIPWHHHSRITDIAYCLEGSLQVETRAPTRTRVLAPGQSTEVPPGRLHRNRNVGDGPCRFLLVQGGGTYDFVKETEGRAKRAARRT